MQRANTKSYFLKTFGCQMNVYDSERMAEALARDGYSETDDVASADLVILNTCHIREKAAEKVYSDLGRMRVIKDARKRDGKDTVIAVAGCVAQAEGPEITARQPAVDLVVGPQSYHRLPELIARAGANNESIVETEFPGDEKFAAMKAPRRVSSPSAFLTVQEGCDKFCTFCVVPYTRGAEFSRPLGKLEAEARELAAAGARELVLLGQNVNAYHGEGPGGRSIGLAELIRRLAEIDGIDRIRYTTSHPRDMSDDLIAAHAEVPQLMPFLHLPVQSGSDRMLAAMNRKHGASEYIELIARIREARPDIALSSDFIVGFPGETDEDAEATIDLVKAVGFAQAFSFKYSPRPGTPAAGLEVQVSEEVKAERLYRLQALLEEQQLAFNEQTLGSTIPVLFERRGRQPGEFVGRTPYLQLVYAAGDGDLTGRTADVRVTETRRVSLSGVISAV
ncbi:tRNA (N6-isopentenyl adenosine(37)-C2)-methylthiotransferase MiaB [Hyphomicrobium sp.]|uniref:tRNA (N6-isopentenyl adenosine(37)-C2)-methylthiotransferase MiaB n=1 Tax=Hyphomicrobium sp. TaxID=82 RepID=UPI002D785745|nr:tRNA (N6-isopentenyl adenosine(37)-C2)-methylthiotransferase MiaB [Hyphomicrobium sp.]HET6388949.1 tRNA (N6-isopentenyl adenosine(37)-C2)-methylthiotransferase MiaB [Hyphomicrobium sp.]